MKTNYRRAHQVLLILVPLFALLVLFFYIAGAYYFRDHFPFHTTFLNYDVSLRDISSIDECLKVEAAGRTLTLVELDDQQEILDLSDVGYKRTVEVPAAGWIPSGDPWYWPLSLFDTTDVSQAVSSEYDPELLEEAIDQLNALDPKQVTPPEDAYLEWQGDELTIVPEVKGNLVDRDRLAELMDQAITSDREVLNLVASGCYIKPDVLQDDRSLTDIVDRYEAMGFQRIDVKLPGDTLSLSPQQILDTFYWINPGTNAITLRVGAVMDFVRELKENYDTYETQRSFINHNGDEIQVGTGADTYGYRMDYTSTVALLLDTLRSVESAEIEPVWTISPSRDGEGSSEFGDTYIEVSIAEQTLWGYVDGEEVISSEVVTGNAGDHDTPKGVFQIIGRSQQVYLEGEDYRTFVNYWMPINYEGVGLHDATWRSRFGGDIYTYDGSHGCVNLPYDIAVDIFYTFSAGTPVIIW